ncbi:MAG: EutN/CcmL family microcompartment protein [Planctomycetales bacterium]|nr:EutN/CcmL family microcompartment protein [Planctomycetales bacterium]
MQAALIVGKAHSTVKHPTLQSRKLLVAQPLMADQVSPDGPPMIVVDAIGAGTGQKVMLTSDGAAIRDMFGVQNSPIRWAVLGLLDD